MTKEKSEFELLRDKNILAILDGDTQFGTLEIDGKDSDISISMPYLSGPVLCDISNKFGMEVTYGWSGGAQSRWAYLDDLIVYCIEKSLISEMLSFLFSEGQFVDKLKGYTPQIIKYAHAQIVGTIIDQINGILYFSGNELVKNGWMVNIREIKSQISLVTPCIKTIDRQYITDLSERAMKDIIDRNYDSAITKARTLLEEVFFYVIEKKNVVPSQKGNIKTLYKQVKELYNMHQNEDMDKRINMLLSGLEKILDAIAEMRNKTSDSHGIGCKRINIDEHHARLFLNSSMTMADFVLAVNEKASKNFTQ